MRHGRRLTAVVVGCGAFVGLFLLAEDVALAAAAAVVLCAWVWLVLLGDGERELRRVERIWGPLHDTSDRDA